MAWRRRILRVSGTVQGVGFRPFVYRTACELDLRGSVRNDPDGVVIDAEGEEDALDALVIRIRMHPPPAARIESLEAREASPEGRNRFVIEESRSHPERSSARVSPDLALCPRCLSELLDPLDRRYRYAFINCTDCGPRYSIAREVPYDRVRTTMSRFDLCPSCGAEYHAPPSRRFHAQPNACANCGPRIWIHERSGQDPVQMVAAALLRGEIAAVKGLGGFHLACDAGNEAAVSELRRRKKRPDKPFAVMFPDLPSLEEEAVLSRAEIEALQDRRSPIVLLSRRSGPSRLAPSISPRLTEIGAFLPYTPLHHLILRATGRPLVMTSGNRSEEPIAAANDEGLARLSGIADVFLLHDRDIHMRSDDSVIRLLLGREQVLRRARGYVPEAVDLGPVPEGPPLLAVGSDLKNTLCLAFGRSAVLSQHMGDLAHYESQRFFGEVLENLERLFQVRPEVVAHDLHPGYHGTAMALRLGLPTIAVQHHHAHIASCLVDNEWHDRVIGVAWDGTGYGADGSIWGGEFLVADRRGFERLGRIRPVPLPGGDRAVMEPWRMAVSHLLTAGLSADRIRHPRRAALESMIRNGLASVPTSSAGRWFDAVASALGIRDVSTYEGQAAMELEAISDSAGEEPYPLSIEEGALLEINPAPTWKAIVSDLDRRVDPALAGSRFHATLASAIAEVCRRIRARTGLSTVALSGGCFQSRILTVATVERLRELGFETLIHSRIPPGDGGIAIGQAAIAAWSKDWIPP